METLIFSVMDSVKLERKTLVSVSGCESMCMCSPEYVWLGLVGLPCVRRSLGVCAGLHVPPVFVSACLVVCVSVEHVHMCDCV